MIRSVLSKVGSFSKVSATFNQDSISLHNIINAYKFNAFWLRDNCRCPQCFHKPSAQRLVDTFKYTMPSSLPPFPFPSVPL